MLDLTKPVQTRAGRPARILATDRQAGIYTVVALRKDRDDYEICSVYTPEGRFSLGQEDHPYDLVNVPETITVKDHLVKNGTCVNVTTVDGVVTKVELVS